MLGWPAAFTERTSGFCIRRMSESHPGISLKTKRWTSNKSICKCSRPVFLQGLENTHKPPGQGHAWNTCRCGMVAHTFLMTFLYKQNPSREAAYSGQNSCQVLLFSRAGLKFSIQGPIFLLGQTVSPIEWSIKVTIPQFFTGAGFTASRFLSSSKISVEIEDIRMGSCSGLAGSRYFFCILMYFWNIRNSLFKNSWQIFELHGEMKYLWTLEQLCQCLSASRCNVPACLLFCSSCLQLHSVK